MCINMKCPALLCLSSLTEGGTSAEASLEGVPTSHPSLCFLLLNQYCVSHCVSQHFFPVLDQYCLPIQLKLGGFCWTFCQLYPSMSLILKCQRKLIILSAPVCIGQLKDIFYVSQLLQPCYGSGIHAGPHPILLNGDL